MKDEQKYTIDEQGYTVYGPKKGFKKESYMENDPMGKKEGVILLKYLGWSPKTDEELFKRGDAYFEKIINGISYIRLFEFERRGIGLRWVEDRFPHPTIHIPIRKNDLECIYDYYIAFNHILDRSAIIKRNYIQSAKITRTDTRNDATKEITKNEPFPDVDCSVAWMCKKIGGIWVQSSERGRTWKPKVNR